MIREQAIWDLLKVVRKTKGLSPYPISLYAAMLSCWQEQNYQIPFRITRLQLMELSGIRSFATYHKCLKQLIEFRYILYEPSFDKRVASRITLITGGNSTEKG